jgi:F-type H+-transporting ATPase subunit b
MARFIIAQADAQSIPEAVEQLPHEEGEPLTDTHATTAADGGEHAGDVFPPFDPSTFPSQLLWLVISFAALYLLMSRVALPKIGGILEDRKSRIDADLAAADASRQKTDAAIAAYESALAAARKNAHDLAEVTRSGIKADLATKRKAVEAELSAKLGQAEASIQGTKRQALTHVEQIAAEAAQSLVSRLVGPVSDQDARAAVAQVKG